MTARRIEYLLLALILALASGAWAVGDGLSEPAVESAQTPEVSPPAAETPAINVATPRNTASKHAGGKDTLKDETKDSASKESGGKDRNGRGNKGPITMTPEREAAAVTFVTRHHPDLAQLLKHLKQSHPKEYQRAIRELFRTSENLAITQETDVRRYDLDLRAWQLKSRIQLLAARLSMGYNKALENELRKVLAEQLDVRIQQQTLVRERMAVKVQELDDQIARLTSNREAEVNASLQRILEEVPTSSSPDKKPSAVPAEPATSDAATPTNPTTDGAARGAKPKKP